jgi:hypothetical protein
MDENVQDVEVKETEKVDQEFNLTLTLSEVNILLASLDELPHKISRKLIDKVVQQAQSQVKQPT